NGRARDDADRVADFLQNLQILQAPVPTAHALGDLQHPGGAFPAGRALPARLVGEEPADVMEVVDNAGRLVENPDRGGPQPQAPALARAIEVQRRIELLPGSPAHAEAAGNTALALASFPDAAAVPVDEFADGDAHGQLHAARPVHVTADAIELGPVAAG